MKGKTLLALGCILLSLILLLTAGAMLYRELMEIRAAAVSVQEALLALDAVIPNPVEIPRESEGEEQTLPTDPTDPPSLSSEILDGHEYVGFLMFPSLDRKLPVMKIAFIEDLQIAPCLERGSPWTDDAVISAHNYPSHFGPIRDWTGGEEVIFASLEGQLIHYTVTLVQTIDGTDVELVYNSEHDLVLYTCTPGGAKRVMLACDRKEN